VRSLSQEKQSNPWLERTQLETLQGRFAYPKDYSYEAAALQKRGEWRAADMLALLGGGDRQMRRFLELGCADGMTGAALAARGKLVTAVDTGRSVLDARAKDAGVGFRRMDAGYLQLDDDTYDVVYSYNSFEHFSDPARVLSEAARTTRKGGYIYLSFGPLYYSPWGLHAYRSVTVPYCHLLFRRQDLARFTGENGLPPIDFKQVNGWSLQAFRTLWRQFDDVLQRVRYREYPDTAHVNLIEEYPSCFRGKVPSLDDLTIYQIEVLFRKHN
jgi:SAM-dependent methyltransferase